MVQVMEMVRGEARVVRGTQSARGEPAGAVTILRFTFVAA
jgi:hypothetical protein